MWMTFGTYALALILHLQTSHMGKKRAIMRKIFAFKELKDDLTSARHLIEDDPYLEVSIDGNVDRV